MLEEENKVFITIFIGIIISILFQVPMLVLIKMQYMSGIKGFEDHHKKQYIIIISV